MPNRNLAADTATPPGKTEAKGHRQDDSPTVIESPPKPCCISPQKRAGYRAATVIGCSGHPARFTGALQWSSYSKIWNMLKPAHANHRPAHLKARREINESTTAHSRLSPSLKGRWRAAPVGWFGSRPRFPNEELYVEQPLATSPGSSPGSATSPSGRHCFCVQDPVNN
ncbi:MAG: hypothetical protein RL367_2796 [Pseudomonadota bacterium]